MNNKTINELMNQFNTELDEKSHLRDIYFSGIYENTKFNKITKNDAQYNEKFTQWLYRNLESKRIDFLQLESD